MSDFFQEALRGGLDSLTADQLDELIIMANSKRSELTKEEGRENTDIQEHKCPKCDSTSFSKYGKTKKGTQRFICNKCRATTCLEIDADNKKSRLTKTQMSALLTGIIQNLTISQLADNMKISKSAAAKHKLKIMDILNKKLVEHLNCVDSEGNVVFKFEDRVQCDEWFCRVSFKGKRDPEFFIFTLKRFPRHNCSYEDQDEYLKKHGLWEKVIAIPGYLDKLRENTKRYRRGISNEHVCIVVAVDDEKNIIAKPVSVGRLEAPDAQKLLSGHFDKGSTLITDNHSAYPALASSEDIKHIQIKADKHTYGPYSLASVNSVHSQIEKFIPESAERIPATKYLNQYMALFIWLWLHKGLSLDEKVMMLRKTISTDLDKYSDPYETIVNRPMDINTKGQFPQRV